MTKNMGKAHTLPATGIHTLVPSRMNCLTGRGPIPMQMATNMLANSRMENAMAKAFPFLPPAATSMKGLGKTTSKVGKAPLHRQMAISTSELLRITDRLGKVRKPGQMATSMSARSRITNKTAKALIAMPMGINTLENSLMIKNMEKAHLPITMVTFMSALFKVTFPTAKVRIATLMAVNMLGLSRMA